MNPATAGPGRSAANDRPPRQSLGERWSGFATAMLALPRYGARLVWLSAAAIREDRRRKHVARTAQEIEFLPPILEVMERPLSPTLKWVMRACYGFFTVAIIGAAFAKTEIHVRVRGKLEPVSGETVVRPLHGGRVVGLEVREGEKVWRGQPLLEFDRTEQEAQLESNQVKIQQRVLTQARILAALDHLETGEHPAPLQADGLASPYLVTVQNAILDSDVRAFEHMLQEQRKRIGALQARHDGLVGQTEMLVEAVDLYDRKMQRMQGLVEKKWASLRVAERDKLGLLEAKGRQNTINSQIEQVAEQILSTEMSFRRTVNDRRRRLNSELETTLNQLAELHSRERTLAMLLKERAIVAPFDGEVQRVSEAVRSGVLQAGEAAFVLVNTSEPVIMRGHVPNADVNHVKVGQTARIKFESFDYSDFGVMDGRIEWIAPGSETVKELGDVYAVTISLARDWMERDGRRHPVRAGMTARAGIVTGERTLLAWFLAPFEKAFGDAFHEK